MALKSRDLKQLTTWMEKKRKIYGETTNVPIYSSSNTPGAYLISSLEILQHQYLVLKNAFENPKSRAYIEENSENQREIPFSYWRNLLLLSNH